MPLNALEQAGQWENAPNREVPYGRVPRPEGEPSHIYPDCRPLLLYISYIIIHISGPGPSFARGGTAMEIRKVQLTGGSSYVVTLPKEWVKSQKINKNDPVGLIAQPDGTLLLTSKTTGGREARVKELHADDISDPVYLYRQLIGIYIMGYSTIVVSSKKRLPPGMRDSVIGFTQMAIGPEIMEEDMGAITIKDMLDPSEMPFDKTIRRMYVLVRTMHEDALTSLRKADANLAEDVKSRDSDVDRLHLLIARQSNMMLRDTTLAKKMGASAEESVHYFIISRVLERIGDHAVRIEDNIIPLIKGGNPPDRKVVKKIAAASEKALEALGNSAEALFTSNMELAHQTIESVTDLTPLCDAIAAHSPKKEDASSVALNNIAESIRRMGEYSGDISELVINYAVQRS